MVLSGANLCHLIVHCALTNLTEQQSLPPHSVPSGGAGGLLQLARGVDVDTGARTPPHPVALWNTTTYLIVLF